jgi:predicted nucleotidyltransferase
MEDVLLDDIIQRIVERIEPEKVYLFGSRARGESDAESDYDLLVVADMPDVPRRRRSIAVRRLFPRLTRGMDVIVKTPEEFERGAATLNHICSIVQQEGRVVYER